MVCDVTRAKLYVQISPANKAWLRAVSRDAGLSDARALDAILDEARQRNWTLREHPAQVVEA